MVSRRQYLRSVGVAGLGALAGCNAVPFVRGGGSESSVLRPRVVHSASQWGEAVAVADGRMVVGAPKALTRTNTFGGAAFAYERDGGEWAKRARLWPPSRDIASPPEAEAQLSFGSQVALADGTAVVTNRDGAAVYWYARDGDGWGREGARYPGPGLDGDGYLFSAGFDGETFAVSTFSRRDDGTRETVHVYDAGDWSKTAELRRPDAPDLRRFGYAVAVAGDTLAVAGTEGNGFAPVVAVYERGDGGWERAAELRPDFPTAHAGTSDHDSLAVSGDTLVIGNLADEDANRHVLVYERDDGAWTRRATLRPDALGDAGALGETIALDGGTLVATAPGAETEGDAGVDGSAFRYDRSGGEWTLSRRYSADDAVEPGRFGLGADLSADRVAVGGRIHREDLTDRPCVYVFDR